MRVDYSLKLLDVCQSETEDELRADTRLKLLGIVKDQWKSAAYLSHASACIVKMGTTRKLRRVSQLNHSLTVKRRDLENIRLINKVLEQQPVSANLRYA